MAIIDNLKLLKHPVLFLKFIYKTLHLATRHSETGIDCHLNSLSPWLVLSRLLLQEGGTILTTAHGQPIGKKTASVSVGQRGPLLLQDVAFLDEMAHFDRERIPERVVHAKGAGRCLHSRGSHGGSG